MSYLSKITAKETAAYEAEIPVANEFTLRKQGRKWFLMDQNSKNVLEANEPFITIMKFPEDNGTVSVATGELPKDLRRKGIATSVYLGLAKHYGKIRSDSAMSEDAADLWRYLVKKHGAKVISTDLEEYADSPSPQFPESAKHPDYKYDPKTEFWRFELVGK